MICDQSLEPGSVIVIPCRYALLDCFRLLCDELTSFDNTAQETQAVAAHSYPD